MLSDRLKEDFQMDYLLSDLEVSAFQIFAEKYFKRAENYFTSVYPESMFRRCQKIVQLSIHSPKMPSTDNTFFKNDFFNPKKNKI